MLLLNTKNGKQTMKFDKILLDHGSGGKVAHQLTTELLLPMFDNPMLAQLHDGAIFETGQGRLAFSTDTFVVDPIFFPGGIDVYLRAGQKEAQL